MKDWFTNLKLNGKLSLVMLCASLIPLMMISVIVMVMFKSSMQEQVANQLESVLATRKIQIEDYFEGIQNQVVTLSENKMIIDAMLDFKLAFHKLPEEKLLEPGAISDYQVKLDEFYNTTLKDSFAKKNQAEIYPEYLTPKTESAIIAQYLYIASNQNPVGSKNKLIDAQDGSSYSSAHKKYHPIINNYLEKFGFYDIFLIDAETHEIVYSVFKEIDYANPLKNTYLSETNFAQLINEAKNLPKGRFKLTDFKTYLPSYNDPAAFISAPLYDHDKLIGVLAFQMPIGHINRLMQINEGLGKTGETYLIGDDLLMRSQSRFSQDNTVFKTKVDTETAKLASDGNKGYAAIYDYRGIKVLSAYSPIKTEGLDWSILAEMDESEAYATIKNILLVILAITIGVSILMAFISYFLATRMAKPIVQATLIAESIAQGNLDNEVEKQSNDEIGVLIGSLDVMQKNLADTLNKQAIAHRETTAAHQEISAITNAIGKSQAVIHFNMDGTIIDANELFLQAVGYSLDEIKGRHHRLFVSKSIAESEEYRRFWAKLNRGEYDSGEFCRIAKDGKELWIQATYNPIFDLNGNPVRVIKYATDITEQVQNKHVLENVFAEVARVMKAMSSGDLTQRITGDYQGVYAQCKNDINETVDKLSEIVNNIRSSADFIGNTSHEIASGNNNLSQRVETQASSLEETASSMEQLTGTVKNNADNAQQASNAASAAKQLAEKGGAVVDSAVLAMSEINESSNKIAEIIGVIDEIAFQTNLLSLNASVEAARAGDHGRGFSVVATEVRNLAHRSAVAAKESKLLIETSMNKVRSGTELVNDAGTALQEIVVSVNKVGDIISEIALASKEQAQGIQQVNQAVSQMDEITQQNAALAEEASAASISMSDQSAMMVDLLGFFNLDKPIESKTYQEPITSPIKHNPKPITKKSNPVKSDEWDDF